MLSLFYAKTQQTIGSLGAKIIIFSITIEHELVSGAMRKFKMRKMSQEYLIHENKNRSLNHKGIYNMVSGTFEISLKPLESYAEGIDGVKLGRMSIDKTFSGPLSAVSKGEMLNALLPVEGSAGYVALEQVIGELEGKKGSFVLQHYGIMHSQGQQLTLEVLANSGTGELSSLSGKMNIRIENGQHYYDFDYSL